MIFVDTSALFAVHDGDDLAHGRASQAWVEMLESKARLVTTNYVETEATALFQRRLGMHAVRALFQSLRACRVHSIDSDIHSAGVEMLLTQNRRHLSLVDCTSFATMRRLGITQAFAYDRDFEEFGFTPVP